MVYLGALSIIYKQIVSVFFNQKNLTWNKTTAPKNKIVQDTYIISYK